MEKKIQRNLSDYRKYYSDNTHFVEKWFIEKFSAKHINSWDFLGNYPLINVLKNKNKKYLSKEATND